MFILLQQVVVDTTQSIAVIPALPDTVYIASPNTASSLVDTLIDLGPIIVGIAGILIGYLYNLRSLNHNRAALQETTDQNQKALSETAKNNRETLKMNYEMLREQQLEEERKDIYNKLNEFYGPCLILLKECKRLSEIFYNGAKFRTLVRLLNLEKFTCNDDVLLNQIMNITDEISKLILEKSGLVEDEEVDLQNLLSKARAHYRILRLAYSEGLKGEVDRFKHDVYPKELDQAIAEKKRSLENRLKELKRIKISLEDIS